MSSLSHRGAIRNISPQAGKRRFGAFPLSLLRFLSQTSIAKKTLPKLPAHRKGRCFQKDFEVVHVRIFFALFESCRIKNFWTKKKQKEARSCTVLPLPQYMDRAVYI